MTAGRASFAGAHGSPARSDVDVAHVGFTPVGEVGLLAVVLRHSGATWAQWIDFNASTAVFGRAFIDACVHFGGTPRRWVFEEPDCRVLHSDGRTEHFAAVLQAVAEHMASSLELWHGRYRGPAVNACERIVWARPWPSRVGLAAGNAALRVWLSETLWHVTHSRQPSREVIEVVAEDSRLLLGPLPASWAALDPRFAAEGEDGL